MTNTLRSSLLLSMLATSAANAQSYTIDWFTIDGGGGDLVEGDFLLRGTVAQLDAGPALRSGDYVIAGGFWSPGVHRPYCVADIDDGSGTGAADGGIGIEDLLYFLNIYNLGLARADVDDGTSTGRPDGGIGIEDLLYYLARYDAGC